MTIYTATISYTLRIDADGEAVARAIAISSIPKHTEITICSLDGSGNGRFKKGGVVSIKVAPKRTRRGS